MNGIPVSEALPRTTENPATNPAAPHSSGNPGNPSDPEKNSDSNDPKDPNDPNDPNDPKDPKDPIVPGPAVRREPPQPPRAVPDSAALNDPLDASLSFDSLLAKVKAKLHSSSTLSLSSLATEVSRIDLNAQPATLASSSFFHTGLAQFLDWFDQLDSTESLAAAYEIVNRISDNQAHLEFLLQVINHKLTNAEEFKPLLLDATGKLLDTKFNERYSISTPSGVGAVGTAPGVDIDSAFANTDLQGIAPKSPILPSRFNGGSSISALLAPDPFSQREYFQPSAPQMYPVGSLGVPSSGDAFYSSDSNWPGVLRPRSADPFSTTGHFGSSDAPFAAPDGPDRSRGPVDLPARSMTAAPQLYTPRPVRGDVGVDFGTGTEAERFGYGGAAEFGTGHAGYDSALLDDSVSGSPSLARNYRKRLGSSHIRSRSQPNESQTHAHSAYPANEYSGADSAGYGTGNGAGAGNGAGTPAAPSSLLRLAFSNTQQGPGMPSPTPKRMPPRRQPFSTPSAYGNPHGAPGQRHGYNRFGSGTPHGSRPGASTPGTPSGSAITAAQIASLAELKDVAAWLRLLRLHKYTEYLKDVEWEQLIEFSDADLEKRGVKALGARNKLLKCFGVVKDGLAGKLDEKNGNERGERGERSERGE